MDTCYLCVLGGKKLSSPIGRPSTTDGFGTCADCAVHACAVHGDKPLNKNTFRCADCWSAQVALAVLQLRTPPSVTSPGSGPATGSSGGQPQVGPDDSEAAQLAAMLARFGPSALAAITPGLGPLAFQYIDSIDRNRMARSCQWLRQVLVSRDRAALSDLQIQVSGGLETESSALAALGWESSARDFLSRSQMSVSYIARTRLAIAFDILLSEVIDNPNAPRPGEQGTLGALAVLMAYAARGTRSIDNGILVVPGALLLRPIILALGIAYWREPAR